MHCETWKPVPVPPFDTAYEISDQGRVRKTPAVHVYRNPRCLAPVARRKRSFVSSGSSNGNGYKRIGLVMGTNRRRFYVHRLVAMAFLGMPDDATCIVNHRDSNPTNNAVPNLEWGSQRDNIRHAVECGRLDPSRARAARTKLTDVDVATIRLRHQQGETIREIANDYRIHPSWAGRIIREVAWA